MDNIDDLLDEMENPEYRASTTVRILVGKAAALLAEHAAADEAARLAVEADSRENREPQAPALAAKLREIEERIEDAKTAFTFRNIGRKAWADLVASNPPSKDHLKLDPQAQVNPETFPQAAIAASCASPSLTVEQVARIENAVTDAQWNALFGACLTANVGGNDSPKSVLAGLILQASERSATTAANEESPDRSS